LRLFFLFFLLLPSLYAESDLYEKGKILYFEKGCNGCHGTKAEGMTNYPFLANRAKGYLAYKLERFRDKISDKQVQEMMIPFAENLSDKEIDALTTFLSEYHDEQGERYEPGFETWGDGGS
jgi:cytochrome c553